MGVSPRGDVAVLAGRKFLAVVDVDVNPGALVARTDRGSKWDAACVSLSHGAPSGANGTVSIAVASNTGELSVRVFSVDAIFRINARREFVWDVH